MNKRKNNGGYVVILNVLFFLVLSLVVIFGITGPVLGSHSIGKAFLNSKQALIAASSAGEDAVYRLRRGMRFSSSETLDLASGHVVLASADSGDNKVISVTATNNEFQRSLNVVVNKGVGVSFNYGLQSGRGGFEMSANSGINGNVYSNGDIIGNGGPYISGSAYVANGSDPISNQSNPVVLPIEYSVDYGGSATPQDAAMSFTVSTTTPITGLRVYIKKSQNALVNNTSIKITTDNNGKPSKTVLAEGTISANNVTTAYNYLVIPLTQNPSLSLNTTYWVVFDSGTTAGSFYSLGASLNSYSSGGAKSGQFATNNGGTWSDTSPSGLDIFFDLYVGGEYGKISGISIGSAGGDAWAHNILNSNVSGTIYCQTGSGNNKDCDISRADPVQQPMPVSDANIEEWKSVAASGDIINGNINVPKATSTSIGPAKIVGDINVGSGSVLTILGTIWVTGDVTISGGGIIKLGTNYSTNSGVLVVDGLIKATGGGSFDGSGTAGSYILAVSTSQCPYSGSCGNNQSAIYVTGGAGSVVLNAQQGNLEFAGGASAKQATARKVIMGGGAMVDYETGLANVNFISGPSGSWNIIGWGEVE